MRLFDFFNRKKRFAEFSEFRKDCFERIKYAVTQKCGIENFIKCDDSTVAFAGSKDNPDLVLELYTIIDKDEQYLRACIDDDLSLEACDFDSIYEFEKEIINYISNRINQTIKTVITKEKHKSYHESVYVLDKNTGSWVLIEEEHTEEVLFCRHFADKTETIETIKTYKLEV